jgi:predicted small lipoprotein YifL
MKKAIYPIVVSAIVLGLASCTKKGTENAPLICQNQIW